jgi:hypothetical protein
MIPLIEKILLLRRKAHISLLVFGHLEMGCPVAKYSEDGQLQLKRKVAQVIGLLGKHDYHVGISHVLSLERTISGCVESKEFQE